MATRSRSGDPGGQGCARRAAPPSQVRRKTAIATALTSPLAPLLLHHQPRGVRSCSRSRGTRPAARQAGGRDRDVQAILPLKGRPQRRAGGASQVPRHRLTSSQRPLLWHGNDSNDPGRLRYGKVILLTDTDSEGHHIAIAVAHLLLPHVPPDPRRRVSSHAPALQDHLGKETHGRPTTRPRRDPGKLPRTPIRTSSRFKGLGEIPAQLLFETTLDPARRAAPRDRPPRTTAPTTEPRSPTLWAWPIAVQVPSWPNRTHRQEYDFRHI